MDVSDTNEELKKKCPALSITDSVGADKKLHQFFGSSPYIIILSRIVIDMLWL